MMNKKILLGSGSPRRKLLLKELGFDFRVMASDVDETPPAGKNGEELSVYLAKKKASALINHLEENEILLTADTIVWLNNETIGKPDNEEDAFKMLSLLNDNSHDVFTGICIKSKSSETSFSVRSEVRFRNNDEAILKKYIQLCKPFDKAGAYGAQECLPENVNPCSELELMFMLENKYDNLYKRSMTGEGIHIPLIEEIRGSYFNVMGLPVVEVVGALGLFSNINKER